METKRKIVAFLQKVKSRWFPSEEDGIWQRWVDFKRREMRDLRELLKQDVREGFKARAVFLLLVPEASWNPIYWTGEQDLGKFYHDSSFLKDLSPELLGYAADLICEFRNTLQPLHCEKPKHIAEGTPGFMVYMQVPDKYHSALYFYNRCILDLLALLPEEKAGRAFDCFSIRDVSTFWNMDDASGYNPLQQLLFSSDVDEKWKQKADAQMREIVLAEHLGTAKPREEWEQALGQYADIVVSATYSKELPYSKDFFASQLEFLISGDVVHVNSLVNSWRVSPILKIITGDQFRDLRHQFARFVVSRNGEPFKVYCKETEEAAEMILAELKDSDADLRSSLETALEAGRQSMAKAATKAASEQKKAQEARESLLQSMK